MPPNILWFDFFIFLLTTVSKKIVSTNICSSSFPHQDHALLNHVIKTLKDKTFDSCTFSCELDPQCFSVNYVPSLKDCHLNQATREFFGEDFVQQDGVIYIDIVIRKYHPCLRVRCLNGGTCTGSPNMICACPGGFSGPHCENQNALGMQSGAILNADITASSNKRGYEAFKGRLYGNSCWKPLANKQTEYIIIDLHRKVNITAIATQGAPTDACWVTSYTIQYYDGNTFENYPKVLPGNSDKTTVVTQQISRSFEASQIRIYPKTWASCIAMRIELYGG